MKVFGSKLSPDLRKLTQNVKLGHPLLDHYVVRFLWHRVVLPFPQDPLLQSGERTLKYLPFVIRKRVPFDHGSQTEVDHAMRRLAYPLFYVLKI